MRLAVPLTTVFAAVFIACLLNRARADDKSIPAKRWKVVATPFESKLQAYGGTAVYTAEGDLIGWNGHQDPKSGNCILLYMRPPDMSLKALACKTPAPSGYLFPSLVYDDASKNLWCVGGWPANQDASYHDMFRLQLGKMAWEKVDQGDVIPPGRNGAGAIFDRVRNRIVIFGGDGDAGTAFKPLGDCWQFDIKTSKWSEVPAKGSAPPARWHLCMTVDQDAKKAYVFGGAGRNVPFDDNLYELDLASDVWRVVKTSGDAPPSLQGASMTFDTKNHVIVLAGGLLHKGSGTGTLSTAWVFDPASSQWDQTDCGEVLRRRDHLGAYDEATAQHILIGGRITTPVGNFYGRGTSPDGGVALVVQKAD